MSIFEEDGIHQDAVPLRREENGTVRIADSRILLELVIHAYQDGATPEAIDQRYDSLDFADVHAVIAYYLKHRQQIEDYLAEREKTAALVKAKVESHTPELREIRNRLPAYRTRPEVGS